MHRVTVALARGVSRIPLSKFEHLAGPSDSDSSVEPPRKKLKLKRGGPLQKIQPKKRKEVVPRIQL